MTVLGPNKGYTFRHFENAQLQGQLTFVIEDGSNVPRTHLGKRAALEQGNQMRVIDPLDPDQRWSILQLLGLTDLVPALNSHVQSALQVQDEFERWLDRPEGPMPLVLKPWYDPQIHWTERIKWLNTDKMRELMLQRPEIEQVITLHLQELAMALAPPALVGPDGKPLPQGENAPGGGQAMSGARREMGATKNVPSGNSQIPNSTSPGMGPA